MPRFRASIRAHQERRSCPQCGAKVGPKGSTRVVPLFLSNLVATDTGELETARNLLDEEKRLRKQVSISLTFSSVVDMSSRWNLFRLFIDSIRTVVVHPHLTVLALSHASPCPQCEAERVRVSIQNASLKDQLSRLHRPDTNSTEGRQINASNPNSIVRCRENHLASCLTPGRTSGVSIAPPALGGSGVREEGSVADGSGTPSAPRTTRPYPGAAPHSSQGKPQSWQGFIAGSTVRMANRSGARSRMSESGSTRAAVDSERGVLRFEHLLSKELHAGRVAAFAGGGAGALLVSQGFATGGGSRGSMRHGLTKV